MTSEEYHMELIDLTTRLTNACNDYGLHSDEYNTVLKDIAACAARFNRRRSPSSLFAIFSIIFIFLMLAWIVYSILF
ncbi:hypothetical protein ES707_10574 [subsurface metagenome]